MTYLVRKLTPRGSFVPVLTFLAFLFAGSTSVHADSLLGPNLSVGTPTGDLFTHGGGGGGCGGVGATFTPDTSATNPGYTITINTLCTTSVTAGAVSSKSETFVLTALNGFQIGDISASWTCGETGGVSITLSFNSLSFPCIGETTPGAVGTATGDITFVPVTTLAGTITLAGSASDAGTFTLGAFSEHFSLLPATSTPEPNALLLLCTGLAGLAGVGRRRLLNR